MNNEDGRLIQLGNSKEITGYTWEDIARIMNTEFSHNYSESKYRRQYNKLQTEELMESDEGLDNIEDAIIKMKKEKVKLSDERTNLNGMYRALAREETLKEIALDVVSKMQTPLIAPTFSYDHVTSEKKGGILVVSDWHYGINYDSLGNAYNTTIAKERVETLTNKAIDIILKEGIDHLIVCNLGDLISGNIHLQLRINSRIDVITQTMEVAEIMAEMLNELSTYAEIEYYSVFDNHSRIDPNKKQSLQMESFVRIIDWFLEERLKDNESITIYNDKATDIAEIPTTMGNTILAVHGDKDKQSTITRNLPSYMGYKPDIIVAGHLHHFGADEADGVVFYSNGSLCGTDDYAHSLRVYSPPSQLFIVESVDSADYCVYKILV